MITLKTSNPPTVDHTIRYDSVSKEYIVSIDIRTKTESAPHSLSNSCLEPRSLSSYPDYIKPLTSDQIALLTNSCPSTSNKLNSNTISGSSPNFTYIGPAPWSNISTITTSSLSTLCPNPIQPISSNNFKTKDKLNEIINNLKKMVDQLG